MPQVSFMKYKRMDSSNTHTKGYGFEMFIDGVPTKKRRDFDTEKECDEAIEAMLLDPAATARDMMNITDDDAVLVVDEGHGVYIDDSTKEDELNPVTMTQAMVDSDEYYPCPKCSMFLEVKFAWHKKDKSHHGTEEEAKENVITMIWDMFKDKSNLTHTDCEQLADYSHRLLTHGDNMKRVMMLAVASQLEERTPLGFREDPCVNVLAKMSDQTDSPMWPEDIQAWLNEIRDKYEFPEFGFPRVINDVPLEEFFLKEELILFCAFAEDKHPGVGLTLLAGKLVKP